MDSRFQPRKQDEYRLSAVPKYSTDKPIKIKCKYPAKCKGCGMNLTPGWTVYFIPGLGVFCTRCKDNV